jgi:outer membrane biosynthesis protein TonB
MKKFIITTLLACAFATAASPASAGEGTLDKDLIRRVVRAHIPEIRHCYNQALTRDPTAQGKVVIDFTIGEDGKVVASKVSSSDMADQDAPRCMSDAVLRWSFPRPDGGQVVVSYPFVLEPG